VRAHDCADIRFCRVLSLRWPKADGVERVHRVVMAVIDASLSGSRELGLATVAHLSRYRGSSREHTESDLRIFFSWCQERHLAPLDRCRWLLPDLRHRRRP